MTRIRPRPPGVYLGGFRFIEIEKDKGMKMNTHKAIMKVGFIGLGHMGTGMAWRLLDAGHDVTVYKPHAE